jgi:hypothetical protein
LAREARSYQARFREELQKMPKQGAGGATWSREQRKEAERLASIAPTPLSNRNYSQMTVADKIEAARRMGQEPTADDIEKWREEAGLPARVATGARQGQTARKRRKRQLKRLGENTMEDSQMDIAMLKLRLAEAVEARQNADTPTTFVRARAREDHLRRQLAQEEREHPEPERWSREEIVAVANDLGIDVDGLDVSSLSDEPLTEAKGQWIQGAIKHKGALHSQLGIPPDKPIPHATLVAAASKPGKLGQRARLALKLKGMSKKKAA